MEPIMASQDVSLKLQHLENQMSVHSKLHEQNAETLTEVKNVLVSNAKISQQLVHIDKRLDSHDARFDKIDTRVQTNHNKIVYASGSIAAIILLSGMIFSAFKLQTAPLSTPSVPSDSRVEYRQH